MTQIAPKDPSDTTDYLWDFSGYLGTDTITGVPIFTLPTGLTLVRQENTTTSAKVFISGGTVGEKYSVSCRITTTGGRTVERSLKISVKEL